MKVIFVLFDSLNRGALSPYGCNTIRTPNFQRLAERSITFDNHFVGSLPCMPARRDMHSGRLNYMHRSWGPLEPFDNSFPRILSSEGIYSHIISDHFHYFEDGGTGYTNAFDSWEFIRGQENDPWVAMVEPPIERLKKKFSEKHYDFGSIDPKKATRDRMPRQVWKRLRNALNRERVRKDDDFPTIACFNRGVDFLDTNHEAKNWFLQIEAFDPHEPFHAPQRFKDMYPSTWKGGILDWPKYEKVVESPEEIQEIRSNYAALATMCDEQLGRLLDQMDKLNMWEDTCLILTTDHGFLLSEHGWWGKNRMPYFTELSRIPLFVAHPDFRSKADSRISTLTQTTDLMPTILEMWGLPVPKEVTGTSLQSVMCGEAAETKVRTFGMFGGPIGATDGRYVYYRYPVNFDCIGLNEYTLLPQHMTGPFPVSELANMELHPPFGFSKGVQLMKIAAAKDVVRPPGLIPGDTPEGSSELYDLETDPQQDRPIDDAAAQQRLHKGLMEDLIRHETPSEVFSHYGLQ